MAEEEEKKVKGKVHAEPGLYRVILGSVKFFVFLYIVIIVAIMAGFTVLEPLFSTLGATVLYGVSLFTYILEL